MTEKTVEQQAIQIVKYDPKYAAAIADMWNKSKEFWGGGSTDRTAEEILANEANSDNLYLFLAVVGDEVVGYCSLSEYREDTGALYIPLLNVRPDYHGHKLGKQLIMKAIEKATELGWPRLDLYTWAGNTKAVPLYKKCGFFWENREETTHLMNFMPGLLQQPLFKAYFEQNDWYATSVREIKVEPDGMKVNDFDVFEYRWESETNGQLRIQFERKGRGIRLIETDQYLLEMGMPSTKLVSGREYQIGIKLLNKGNQPLNWEVQGSSDQHIKQDYTYRATVEQVDHYEGAFNIDHSQTEQNEFQTYPGVRAIVSLNGVAIELKLGIETKAPISIEAGTVEELYLPGERVSIYLDVENPFAEAVNYQLELPDTAWLTWEERQHQLQLGKLEKRSTIIHANLSATGFWREEVKVEVSLEDGSTMSYTTQLGILIKGAATFSAGERKRDYVMSAGAFTVQLIKDTNTVYAKAHDKQIPFSYLWAPQLGKPFSSEWKKKRANQVRFSITSEKQCMHIHYLSQSFKDIELIRHIELSKTGWVKQYFELINHGNQPTIPLTLSQPAYQEIENITLPYKGKVIVQSSIDESMLGEWEAKDFTEGWFILQHPQDPLGLAWSKDYEIRINSWLLHLDYEFGILQAKERQAAPPCAVSLAPFNSWKSFRRALIDSHVLDEETTKALKDNNLEAEQNLAAYFKGHNPIQKEAVQLEARLLNKYTFSGESSILDQKGKKVWERGFQDDQQARHFIAEWPVQQDLVAEERVQVYEAQLEMASRISTRELLGLHPSQDKVEVIKEQQEGLEVLKVNNGIIELSAAIGYFPNVYSLKVDGEEWFDHTFPKVGPKSWWNPWSGGLFSKPSNLHARALDGTKHKAEYVQLRDTLGNLWCGLAIQIELANHDKFNNLGWTQYYLMQPGVPLLCYTVELNQSSARYWKNEKWGIEANLIKNNSNPSSAYLTEGTNKMIYRLGKDSAEIPLTETLRVKHPGREWQLQAWSNNDYHAAHIYNNPEITLYSVSEMLTGASDIKLNTSPFFFIFTKEQMKHNAFASLKSIRF